MSETKSVKYKRFETLPPIVALSSNGELVEQLPSVLPVNSSNVNVHGPVDDTGAGVVVEPLVVDVVLVVVVDVVVGIGHDDTMLPLMVLH